MEGQRILITGASGLIGSALCAHLAGSNQVYGLARFSRPEAKKELEALGVMALPFDAAQDDVATLPDEIDYVFHEAVMWSGEWPVVRATNIMFLGKLMERLPEAQFVIGSTGGVYPADLTPKREEDDLAGVGQYCLSSVGKELLAMYFSETCEIPVVILRYYWPYGPGGGVVAQLAQRILGGEPVDLTYASTRQPIYIDDCVRLTVAAAGLCAVPAQVLNLGGSETVSHEELAERIGRALGQPVTFTGTAPPPEQRPSHLGDFSRLHALVGRPEVSLEEGIRRTVEGLRE